MADDPLVMETVLRRLGPPTLLPAVTNRLHPDYAAAGRVRDFCTAVLARIHADDALLREMAQVMQAWLNEWYGVPDSTARSTPDLWTKYGAWIQAAALDDRPFYCTPTIAPEDMDNG